MIQTYFAFDVGTKRTGVAIGNDLTKTAKGFAAIHNHKNGSINWQQLDQLFAIHNVNLIIVGVPYKADGSEQEMTFIAKSFAKKLTDKYKVQHIFVDEFLSSIDAKKQLKYNHYHKNANRSEVDKKSAELILQNYLNEI